SPAPFGTSTAIPSIVSFTVWALIQNHLVAQSHKLGCSTARPASAPGARDLVALSHELGPVCSCRHRCDRGMRVHRDRGEDVVERRAGAKRAAGFVDVDLELGAELVDVAGDRDRSRLA